MLIIGKSNVEVNAIQDLSGLSHVNKKRILTWIEALESGVFSQARGGLMKDQWVRGTLVHSYCCLGVACEITRKEVNGRWAGEAGCFRSFRIGEGASSGGLPIEVRQYFGGNGADPLISPSGIAIVVSGRSSDGPYPSNKFGLISLISLNDSLKASFTEIAGVLRVALDGGYGGSLLEKFKVLGGSFLDKAIY